ncbi:O-acetyl-ADP-ribose deacetylase [Peptococcus niger]|uniref:O-acetyl-ADP-ribose deacetylase (Regulator of RNase III), contains Macro domain n=1 Tax=Peptococcus niger TaxID=2741 RepID=A0A1G6WQI7_PEPNI|nr:O-acetyl-ADP-ribose deacetylase [Peptococcus niger]SDD68081.1 O-acetyl-ADP-ribose deacetylase (regulator of RNase III), contains Macro domain [Peptococcus niger]
MSIQVIQADITRLEVDAIVNAANESLLGGGGVDGAIHRAAGPELLAETRKIGGCPTGQARLSGAYKLPCRAIIHTVGPVWHGGAAGEAESLAACYVNSLNLAVQEGFQSIAFPAISTGVYGYPIEEAADIAVRTVATTAPAEMSVYLVCFNDADRDVYAQALARWQVQDDKQV